MSVKFADPHPGSVGLLTVRNGSLRDFSVCPVSGQQRSSDQITQELFCECPIPS